MDRGIEVLQTSALPLGYGALLSYDPTDRDTMPRPVILKNPQKIHCLYFLRFFFGAGYEIRTRDFHLGKVTLYH